MIDGYCTNMVNKENLGVSYNTILFHCIWGWNGDNNGFFYLNDGHLGDNGKLRTNKYTDLQYIANFRINKNKQSVNLQ